MFSVADESMEAGSGEIESESSELGQRSPTELALPLLSDSLSWRGSPWTLCNNSSDWLDISLFGSCTPQVEKTGSLIRLPTGELSQVLVFLESLWIIG